LTKDYDVKTKNADRTFMQVSTKLFSFLRTTGKMRNENTEHRREKQEMENRKTKKRKKKHLTIPAHAH